MTGASARRACAYLARAAGRGSGRVGHVMEPARERLVVCVGPSPGSEHLVHAAAALATRLDAPGFAVHVGITDHAPLSPVERDRVEDHLTLAESLGAEIAYVGGASIADGVLAFARERGATRIVIGRPRRVRWRDRLRGTLIDQLVAGARGLELHVIAPAGEPSARRRARPSTPVARFAPGVIAVLVATLIGAGVGTRLSLADHAMLYLAAIMIAALGGRAPGVLAAALSVGAYNFFFVPPRYTLAVADTEHLITFAVMFTLGIAMGTVVARLRHAVAASRQRERRTSALLVFTAQAAAAPDAEEVAAALVERIGEALGAPAAVLLPDAAGSLQAVAGLGPHAEPELAVAREAFASVRATGRGTDVHPASRSLAAPLRDGEAAVGVVTVAVERARRSLDRDARVLVEALAQQAGVALARLRLAREAREAALRAQAEELRSSLLSTVSHDLRTPLAVITGMATALRDAAPSLTREQLESLDTIVDEASRLGTILHNLLAITRVESGAELRRDWVPVEELIGAAVARCEPWLVDHPLRLAVDPDAGVTVDPVLFEQLLLNLLENAAKHTPAGTPIDVRAFRDGSDVVIDVSDRGPGLPPGDPARLFEKFTRGAGTRTAGAGLGLAVCRGIALAHGGHIEARPRDGGGATFRVRVAASAALQELAS